MDPAPPGEVPLGRRERNRRDREQAYLDAAMAIATSEGMAALTMVRLAHDVDAAVGSMYTYFPSKGALFAEMQRVAIERLTASYHLVRDRSDADLATWDDPRAVALTRLMLFGRFWIAAVDTFPREASFLHAIISISEVFVPAEERHRVLPSALSLLDEARQAVAASIDAGAISPGDAIQLVLRLAAALTGVLLTANLAEGSPIPFDPQALARDLLGELMVGWGASVEAVAQATAHIAVLEAQGPLAAAPPA